MTKFILISVIIASILILILQASSQVSEAKKIKIKDLKKAKKYAYLLASQRKKLYAIPFPVPLPVFVKRQHIYTQIPVVPRYVQQPYYHHQQESSYDPYASMSAYAPESVQPPVSHHPRKTVATIGRPTKYIAELASVIGHAYPRVLGSDYHIGGQRDVVGKLLSGQAKVLSPATLISSLKQKLPPKQEQEGNKASSIADNSTSKATKEPGNKPSASEIRLRSLPRPAVPSYFYPNELYRMPASSSLLNPYMAPFLPAAQATGALMPHPMLYPMLHSPQLTPGLLQQMAAESQPVEPESPIDEQQKPEVQEVAASSKSVRNIELPGAGRAHPDQLIEAMQKARHHQALQLALAREREEARVAESNALALHAHQLGLPVLPSHLRLLNY